LITGFWQTDPRLNPKIQASGCALLSSLYIAPVDFTVDMANDMYRELLRVGFIDEDCTILTWPSVLWSVSARMQFARRAPVDYICKVNEREIIKWYLSNVKEDHFTVGNGASKTEWDSMNRPDIMAKYATFVEKIIVTVT
jgi:hypothetical protein